MIAVHPKGDLSAATWIDLVSPTPDEIEKVRSLTGLRIPSEDDISEIESSSRLSFESHAFYVTTPLLSVDTNHEHHMTAAGFVLTSKVLLTIRYSEIGAFDAARDLCEARSAPSSEAAFLHILEVIVDRSADALEHAGAECEELSKTAFRSEKKGKGKGDSAALRKSLQRLGTVADKISHVRDSLLGIGRIVAFVTEGGFDGAPQVNPARMKAIRTDITSLTDYESHLSGKIQFLLDATLGFINVDQNEIVKTLTIASVVGIPPVLIAGIYGMNFHVMPELSWPLGYPFALALIVVSGIVPLVWFKARGWM